jgi:hypothetical protein
VQCGTSSRGRFGGASIFRVEDCDCLTILRLAVLRVSLGLTLAVTSQRVSWRVLLSEATLITNLPQAVLEVGVELQLRLPMGEI